MIQNGYLPDANEVIKQQAVAYRNLAQLLYNSARIGFTGSINGTGTPDLYNLNYSILNSNPFVGATFGDFNSIPAGGSNAVYKKFGDLGVAIIGNVYDYLNGTTADTTKWSTIPGSFALFQSGNTCIGVSGANNWGYSTDWNILRTSGTSLNLRGADDTNECIVAVENKITSNNYGDTFYSQGLLKLIDNNGTTITVGSQNAVASQANTEKYYYRLVFTSGNCASYNITTNWNSTPTNYSTTTLTGSVWALALAQIGYSSIAATLILGGNMHPLYISSGNCPDSNIFTNTTNHSENMNAAFVTYNGASGINIYASANSGTNYSALTKDVIGPISTAGSQFKIKLNASGVFPTSAIPKIYEYCALYDVW